MTQPAPLDWRTVPVPPQLESRPRDHRGFIIPASVANGTDHPDFRQVQPNNAFRLTRNELCWLCGGARTYWMTFIGGPLSIGNRLFNDGWMHEACALYGLKVCPFLANPRGRYTSDPDHPDAHPLAADYRPERFGLGYTRTFRVDYRMRVIVAGEFKRVRWFDVWGHELLACEPERHFDDEDEAWAVAVHVERNSGVRVAVITCPTCSRWRLDIPRDDGSADDTR